MLCDVFIGVGGQYTEAVDYQGTRRLVNIP